MPYYYKLGSIPHKRHTQFRKSDGGLYSEQLFSTEGFSNDSSLLYHYHPPTQIIKTEPQLNVTPDIAEENFAFLHELLSFCATHGSDSIVTTFIRKKTFLILCLICN